MDIQSVNRWCAVNCALENIGFFLCFLAESVLLKAVQRSARNTTPNPTTRLLEVSEWLYTSVH